MKRVRGTTSRLMNPLRPDFSKPFDGQDGYAFFRIGQSSEEQEAVLAYARNQKQHHTMQTLWTEWEETREYAPVPPRTPG
jgi:hypothetical protein